MTAMYGRVLLFTRRALFLPRSMTSYLCFQGKPSATAGRKAKGSQSCETARLPEVGAGPTP
jgi:hypothetical protein